MFAACDMAGAPGTASSVASVASRAPGLHERSLGSPAARVGGVRVDEAMEIYTRFETACRGKDAHAVWAALSPGGQADVLAHAKALYEEANTVEQKRLSKLDGEPDIFSPQEYLISQFEKPQSVCPKSAWTLTDKQEYHQLFLMVRHVGEACEGLWFARTEGKIGVFPAGWYDPCPDNPAAQVIADVGQRGRKLRDQQQAEQAKGEPVTPAQVKQAYDAYTKACKTNDVDAMWKLVPEGRRKHFAEQAAKFRDKEGEALLREDGWKGDISTYDARAHFEREHLDRFCPEGTEWHVLGSSTSLSAPGWLVVKATGADRERCDALEVTREGGALRLYARNLWIPKCPPETSISELLSTY